MRDQELVLGWLPICGFGGCLIVAAKTTSWMTDMWDGDQKVSVRVHTFTCREHHEMVSRVARQVEAASALRKADSQHPER